ncbi:hypothetical protein BDM02DRAFT_3186864 [Thelephora ganbajun]|uniref:Uncharacterized protein n=1 Tax=Thelephora ganbajun TaxID=370292 RepID=A0ACB6ZG76_THEGA|nr:hypothetical protein BDM02DRAFT_3186864 [Thelephora ganbajun]
MSRPRAHSDNTQQVPRTMSRSSSITLVTPTVKDGIDEISAKLVEIDDIIEDLGDELSAGVGHIPDLKDLLQAISKLGEDVNKVKLVQNAKIKAIRDEAKEDIKNQFACSMENEIQSFIMDTIATQVKKEMDEWSSKDDIKEFVGALPNMVNENNVLLRETRIHFENSRSRHANSTLDIRDDFSASLKAIKCQHGHVSELFPKSLRELFSYDDERLVQLIKDHNLCPLDKYNENLSRFLVFIGMNASIPDQVIDFMEEKPPAYPLGNTTETENATGTENTTKTENTTGTKNTTGTGNTTRTGNTTGKTTGTRDEKDQKGARGGSSASQDTKQNANSSWWSLK